MSVQAKILNLLQQLQEDLHLALLFIAHDLSVVRYLCYQVAVMYRGRLVEQAETEALFTHPRHPYTATLLHAAPAPDPHAPWMEGESEEEDSEEGAGPPEHATGFCPFVSRCRFSSDLCRQSDPLLEDVAGDGETPHLVACHHKQEIELKGV